MKELNLKEILELTSPDALTQLNHLKILRTFQLLETYCEMTKMTKMKLKIKNEMKRRVKMNSFHFSADILFHFNENESHFTKMKLLQAMQSHFKSLFLFDEKGFLTGELPDYFIVDFTKMNNDFISESILSTQETIAYSYLKPQSDFLRLIDDNGGKLKINMNDISKMKAKTNHFNFISFHFSSFHFTLKSFHFISLLKSNIIHFSSEKGEVFAHLSADWWTKRKESDYSNQTN